MAIMPTLARVSINRVILTFIGLDPSRSTRASGWTRGPFVVLLDGLRVP